MTYNAELAEPFRFYLCEFCVCFCVDRRVLESEREGPGGLDAVIIVPRFGAVRCRRAGLCSNPSDPDVTTRGRCASGAAVGTSTLSLRCLPAPLGLRSAPSHPHRRKRPRREFARRS